MPICDTRITTPQFPSRSNCHGGEGIRMLRVGLVLFVCALLIGCGGRGVMSGNTGTPPSTPTNPGTPTPAPAPAPSAAANSPAPVSLAAGQSQSGIDITVAPPASNPAPNAQDLGVNAPSGLGMASNTGGVIHRGSSMRVLLFGPGLTADMKITLAGPQDITVADVQGVHATDNTPGVAFTASATSTASLGARTVFLQSANGDITSFSGGLEVIP